MHNSPFTVAGMSSSTSSHHSPNLNAWGSASTSGPLATSFGDSLSQSRSHYQSGYLMSSSENNNVPQGNQRVDEVPIVQTKAKMNQILSRGSTADFGMDSMFQSSRQRQTLADEDAPPMSSINDIPNEINLDSPDRFHPRKTTTEKSPFSSSRRAPTAPSPANQRTQPIYIVVFGYPIDKYSFTVSYFKCLGDATEPDQNLELVNCFKIGYHDAGDAMRAVRKNGEVIGGDFMIGAKWADPAQAEASLPPLGRSTFASSLSQNNYTPPQSDYANTGSNAMNVDEPPSQYQTSSSTPTLGTPLKLAPSMSAFRKTPGISASTSKPATPQNAGWTGGVLSTSVSAPVQPSPSKSVMGQMSDLIFGW